MRLCWAVLLVAACSFVSGTDATTTEGLPAPADKVVSFGRDVKPILAHRCFECHGPTAKKGGLQLNSRDLLLKGGVSGAAAVSGKSTESLMIKRLVAPEGERMPPQGEALTDSEIGILMAWVNQGMKWDENAAPAKSVRRINPILRRPSVPAGQDKNPIDRILAGYFQRNAVKGGSIDDVTFARRVYLDIAGVIPPLKPLQEFLADAAPDKRERLVKRLLADNHAYADHWFSFWADLLRSGTTLGKIDGTDVDVSAWLHNALLTNMPYDKFVTELVSPTKPESSGFLTGLVMRGDIPASQTRELQAAQNVSQVFLGVQLKCASCHDSFTSRWTLDDAHGMANIFAERPTLEIARCEVPTKRKAPLKFLYPELGQITPNKPRAERLKELAQIMTRPENGQLTRTIANRLWGRFFGRAIVEPVDEMEEEPWNADLLDFLATDLVDNKYDLKKTMERIFTSRAYQMPAANPKLANDKSYVFRGPRMRRMTAEQFVDSVYQFGGENKRAWREPNNALQEALGRPSRNVVVTTRDSDATALQSLELINGAGLHQIVYGSAVPKLKTLAAETKSSAELATQMFALTLCRAPSEGECTAAAALLGSGNNAEAAADLLWVLLMLPEFQLIR
ncbi:MAG TPA: PSD1 and planctomycete cytochrome C domain-containing protein [Planctomycetota bacterium]|nr:PSD1 and planctomycete cytochrome C domain-containing protein [Planctomycetota bacterium]